VLVSGGTSSSTGSATLAPDKRCSDRRARVQRRRSAIPSIREVDFPSEGFRLGMGWRAKPDPARRALPVAMRRFDELNIAVEKLGGDPDAPDFGLYDSR
jgi:hypothetical protein